MLVSPARQRVCAMAGRGEAEDEEILRLLPPPISFCCPITQHLMGDPVAAADGHVYERAAIEEWFRASRDSLRSPMTNLPLPTVLLAPNRALQSAIEEYLQGRPELARKELDRASTAEAVRLWAEELLSAKSKSNQGLLLARAAMAELHQPLAKLREALAAGEQAAVELENRLCAAEAAVGAETAAAVRSTAAPSAAQPSALPRHNSSSGGGSSDRNSSRNGGNELFVFGRSAQQQLSSGVQ
ncbi:unnamed protein product [Polarella glacialis]|uniref:U-box domain-containing protein n=1 Tax=Polarella glacialis TaxID=89957 RepID=A0A813ES85_POLGL|nr:unnamed protein product [Polarella glacialis]CAE8741966.1 unnamed protein product [Polarella glacialis]